MEEYKRKNVRKEIDKKELEELKELTDDYKAFLDTAKTERLAHDEIIRRAEERGFVNIEEKLNSGDIKPGDKLYASNKNKGVALFVIGKKDIREGMNIVGGHIDSPRLDLKPLPLYEDSGLALLKTHYYGGIKKYQWTNIPLALHGVAFNKEGEKIEVSIGEKEDEPVFFISELLVHLSKDLLQKPAKDVIEGERLNLYVGSIPLKDEKENPVKKNILKILDEKYGLSEEDFISAEFEVVPADKARDVGFDRSMVAAHGQDDRVCSFAGLRAIFDIENPERTCIGLFVDKEEIGSVGATGMQSDFFADTVLEIMNTMDLGDLVSFKRAMRNSKVLSADVTACEDPNYPDETEKNNTAKLGSGIALTKYTGSGGKGGSNDAGAEYLAEVRRAFDQDGVIYQTGELGKVDQGGGGTIAYILAKYGMDVVDCGTGVISMHAPLELTSKADVYESFKAYRAFFRNIK